MGLLSFFSKKPQADEDYEQILADISKEIQTRQTRLNEIRLRERRTTLKVTLYTLGIWIFYFVAWWRLWIPRWTLFTERTAAHAEIERLVKGVPVVLGPLATLFIRRIVQIWYSSKGDTEEKSLKKLHTDQRAKIEEIKKKTNFYSTRNLIERYDVPGSAPSTPQQTPARPNPPGTSLRQRLPPGAQQPAKVNSPLGQTPMRPVNGHASELPGTPSGLLPPPPQPQLPQQKQWYDKLADALLGDDPAALNMSDARMQYALICENCFLHNGLAREGEFEEIQYICPKCGHFNPSRRAKKEKLLRRSDSPEGRPQLPPSPHTPTPSAPTRPPKTPEPRPHPARDAPQPDAPTSQEDAANRTSEGMDVDE
ncbi:hypothetical protein BOTBODRAFT_34781 [Botryobasidium botryosum FD-172 SS1]|uniref:Endoplasmic reticulum junction formation protein lunapark n=1 Tax=Botryobasidium botryosum (strain FD-172 SS1) TaxID=930990 RepID=A0A067MBV3_BOTB1|nr:hypothetical protein BOTBODRAFT_34781 [Botryobasidium botryosum FD-172 SS1]